MIKEKCVWWQRTSEQLGQRMLRFPLSANAYTWITLLVGILGYVFIAHAYTITGLIFLFQQACLMSSMVQSLGPAKRAAIMALFWMAA